MITLREGLALAMMLGPTILWATQCERLRTARKVNRDLAEANRGLWAALRVERRLRAPAVSSELVKRSTAL